MNNQEETTQAPVFEVEEEGNEDQSFSEKSHATKSAPLSYAVRIYAICQELMDVRYHGGCRDAKVS